MYTRYPKDKQMYPPHIVIPMHHIPISIEVWSNQRAHQVSGKGPVAKKG